MPDSSTIQDAVTSAMAEHGLPAESTEEISNTEPTAEETPETPESTETTETPESQESQNLDDRTTKALHFLDMLEDTEKGPELVKEMAQRMGLIESAKTPAKAEKAAETLTDKILAELGEDYPILATKLAKVIDEALQQQEAKFANEINTREMARYEAEIDSRVNKFISVNKVTEAEQLEIKNLASKFPPAPSVPPEEYLAHQLKVVRWEQAEMKTKARTSEKIKGNLAERPASRGVPGNEERIVKPSASLTPLQAVQMAARGETTSE